MGGMVGLLYGGHKCQYLISLNELQRPATEQNPRKAALRNNLIEQAAERKIVSVLFFTGNSRTKKPNDKFPHMRIATVSLREIRENYEQAFQKPRNRTLERYRFSRENKRQKKR